MTRTIGYKDKCVARTQPKAANGTSPANITAKLFSSCQTNVV